MKAEGVDGNIHKAFEWLRKKGQASVMKNNRAANEGLIGVAFEGSEGVIVEVCCVSFNLLLDRRVD